MIVSLETGVAKTLTPIQHKALDLKLRSRLPSLVSWSYSTLTGELTLDLGSFDDDALNAKLQDIIVKADALSVKKIFLGELS